MSTPMFPSNARAGTAGHIPAHSPLTPSGIMSIVQRIATAAGLPQLKPHDLRRTFAGMAKDGGADLDMIKHALGHASMVTTERYLSQIQNLKRGHTAPDHIRINTDSSKAKKGTSPDGK